MATKQEITQAILRMRFLPNSPITDQNVQVVVGTFEEVLADLSGDIVEAAALHYLSTAVFFPSPGALREVAIDLEMLSLGVPTPAEAWGMVLTAPQFFDPKFCKKGLALHSSISGKIGKEYWGALKKYADHVDACDNCDSGGYREDYRHLAVSSTVTLLGGRDLLLTDNMAADRARFIDAYREVVARERMRAGMVPEVRRVVEKRALSAGREPKQISEIIEAMKGKK